MRIAGTLFIFIFLWTVLSQTTSAQDAFEELRFTLTGTGVIGANSIQKNWSPSGGIGFELSTPYYFGYFETGARYQRYNELIYQDSGFHSTFMFVGWHYNYEVSDQKELSVVPGIRFGSRYLIFDQELTYDGEYHFSRFESEFTFEVLFRIQYQMNDRFGFYTSAAMNQTRFNIPYAEYIGSAGITYIFNTSKRMKNFLK